MGNEREVGGGGGWAVGVNGWGGGWAAGDGSYPPLGLFRVAMSPRSTKAIGPDKPLGPKRHLINTGANFRPIPRI